MLAVAILGAYLFFGRDSSLAFLTPERRAPDELARRPVWNLCLLRLLAGLLPGMTLAAGIATCLVLRRKDQALQAGLPDEALTAPNLSACYSAPVEALALDGRLILWDGLP